MYDSGSTLVAAMFSRYFGAFILYVLFFVHNLMLLFVVLLHGSACRSWDHGRWEVGHAKPVETRCGCRVWDLAPSKVAYNVARSNCFRFGGTAVHALFGSVRLIG